MFFVLLSAARFCGICSMRRTGSGGMAYLGVLGAVVAGAQRRLGEGEV